uniref:Uncharacterized protein n=1 Tax=Spermophilus dauricus TaxID=99837 RepID=A0A8C9PD83_SPEDA
MIFHDPLKVIFHDPFQSHKKKKKTTLKLLTSRAVVSKETDQRLMSSSRGEFTFVIWMLMIFQAASHLEEYNEMLELILKWIEKAKDLVHGNIAWNSANQLREQYILHQVILGKTFFKK